MSGPAPKPAELRQRRNQRDIGQIIPIEAGKVVPPPPSGLLAVTKQAWESFWLSPLAQTVTDPDYPSLVRLFELQNELDIIWRAAKKNRLITGSQGQEVLNPLYKQADSLRSEIRQLEDRFGMTPMSRLKLGVKLGEASRSLAADIDGDPDDELHQEEVDAIDARAT